MEFTMSLEELKEKAHLITKWVVIGYSEIQFKDPWIGYKFGKISFDKIRLNVNKQVLDVSGSLKWLLRSSAKNKLKKYQWVNAISIDESDIVINIDINMIKKIFNIPPPFKEYSVNRFSLSNDGLTIELGG